MAKILFIDLETTGFSRDWDYIIEVAAILYDEETQKELDRFHEYIKPGKRLPQQITEITGITEEQLQGCRSEKEVIQDFAEWAFLCRPEKITAYNASFDRGFLDAKRAKYNIQIKDAEWFDMMAHGRRLKKEGKIENYKQTTVASFLGIEYQAHSAIEDVRALIRIFEGLGLNDNIKSKRKQLGF